MMKIGATKCAEKSVCRFWCIKAILTENKAEDDQLRELAMFFCSNLSLLSILTKRAKIPEKTSKDISQDHHSSSDSLFVFRIQGHIKNFEYAYPEK